MLKNFIFLLVLGCIITTCSICSAKIANIVYVYSDDGVGERSVLHTLNCLKQALPAKYQVKTLTAVEVNSKHWTKHAVLFVMPGGADIPYTKKLNGIGNQIIKDYVLHGGSYLGICAGSYYGSAYVEFDKGGKLAVLGKRELAFFPGTAIGPAIGRYDYKSNSGVQATRISTSIAGVKQDIYLFLHGGPYFANAESFPNVSVIGWYNVNKTVTLPAIIHMKYGKGNVVLSGVHFEYDPNMLDKHDKFLAKLLPRLEESNTERKAMVSSLLALLLVDYQSWQ